MNEIRKSEKIPAIALLRELQPKVAIEAPLSPRLQWDADAGSCAARGHEAMSMMRDIASLASLLYD
jgi:hypothetical protein